MLETLLWFLSDEPIADLWIFILFELGIVIYLLVVIFFKNYLTVIIITPEGIRVKNQEYKWNDIYITVHSRNYYKGYLYYAYFDDRYLTEEETDQP